MVIPRHQMQYGLRAAVVEAKDELSIGRETRAQLIANRREYEVRLNSVYPEGRIGDVVKTDPGLDNMIDVYLERRRAADELWRGIMVIEPHLSEDRKRQLVIDPSWTSPFAERVRAWLRALHADPDAPFPAR